MPRTIINTIRSWINRIRVRLAGFLKPKKDSVSSADTLPSTPSTPRRIKTKPGKPGDKADSNKAAFIDKGQLPGPENTENSVEASSKRNRMSSEESQDATLDDAGAESSLPMSTSDKIIPDETASIDKKQLPGPEDSENTAKTSNLAPPVPAGEVEGNDLGESTGVTPTPSSATPPDTPEPEELVAGGTGTQPNEINREGTADIELPGPRNIGSRRTRRSMPSTKAHERAITPIAPKPETTSKPEPKPELICRKKPSSWEIFLYVPQKCKISEVQYKGKPLSPEDDKYYFSDYSGNLSIEHTSGTVDDFLLFDGEPLIFKLSKNWEGVGRKMNNITQGYFIVFTPDEWTRIGHEAIAPEECADSSFKAHYFFMDKEHDTDEKIGFKECSISLSNTGFSLKGNIVFDNSDEGDLYVGEPLSLHPAPGILWARIGEEKSNGWRRSFKAAEESLGDILNGRQGRFFIRVFREGQTHQADSGEFRYFENLREIRVNDELYSKDTLLPPLSGGHTPTTLRFLAADGTTLRAAPKQDYPHVTLEANGVVTLKPCPDADKTIWSLDSSVGSTDVVIQLPRIWWRIVDSDLYPNTWCSKPVNMPRDRFREEKQAKLEIRLPPCIKEVLAGFNKDLIRPYPREKNTCHVEIPLNDFVDYKEIDNPSSEDSYLKIQCGHAILKLIRMPAERKPEAQREEAIDILHSMDGSPPSRNKGFSRHELNAVNLTISNARRLGIRVDKRRRSIHPVNLAIFQKGKEHV